ncbi:hypothetical protein HZS_3704, partial [Henneguya salminicola]
MFKKSKSTGIYMVSDSPCELITISLSEFNKGQKEENVPDEDIDMVEALFDNNLLIAVQRHAEKLIDTLFDEKYLEHEPNFIVDFFISYKIYMDDTKALMNKIELCLNTDVLRQQAVSALITWITYCPDDFQDNYMQDFVIFILNLLQSKSCIALADVVSQVCYNKSMAYESLDQDEDIPIRFKYRIVPAFHCSRNLILHPHKFDPHSKAAGANIQLYDEVLFLNDYAISDINVATLKKILSESTLYLFILKRCVTKYQYVKNALIDLYEAKFRPQSVFSVSSQLERKKTQKSGSIFDTINPRKISVLRVLTLRKNRKKPLTPNVMTDFQTVDSSHSSLGDLINPISEKNVKYPVIQANNDFSHDEINNQENSNVSDSSSNAHFVLKILNASNDPKYSVFSRCDNCKKIAHELFLHSLSYKRATSLLLSDKWATISSSSSPHIFLAKTSPAGFKMSRLNDDFFDLPTKYSPGIRFYTATSSAAIKISSEVEAEMKNEELISLLTLDCCILAKILTIYDFYQFSKIVPKEYLSRVFKKKVNATCYNLEYFEERCNFEVMWVVVEILNEPKLKNRAKLICKFIQIAKYCLELGNFNSFFSLVSGLEHNLILRLKTTWELVTPKSLKLFGYLKSLCSPLNNMSLYRGWLIKYSVSKNRDNNSIIIPLIPLIVKDLTFINDSSKTMFSQNQSLSKAFEMKTKFPSFFLDKPSLSFGPYCPEDNSIMLANISIDILNFT